MATPELGSQPSEQPLSSPVNREHPNRIYKPPLPSNGYELFLRCNFDFQERQKDALLSAQDDRQAQNEYNNLLDDPAYKGETEPIGDGSVLIIHPGYFRGEADYQNAVKFFNNQGYRVTVMPSLRGINIEPSEKKARDNIRFIMNAADRSGKPVITIGHSMGVQDTEVEAGSYPREFEQSVSMVFDLCFPNNVVWVNSEVLCRLNPAYPVYGEKDFKTHTRFASSLSEVKVPRVALINLQDKIIQGTSNAGEVIPNNNSHRGALSCAENLRTILARLPKKS